MRDLERMLMCKYGEETKNVTVGEEIDVFNIVCSSEDPEQIKIIYEDLGEFNFDDEDYENILCAIAQNSNTSSDVLAEIARVRIDELENMYNVTGWLLGKVAENTNTTIDTLTAITNCELKGEWYDGESFTKKAVANNPNVSNDILWKLAHDNFVEVRVAVAELTDNIDLLKVLAMDESKYVRRAVADNSNTTKEMLHIMCGDNAPMVREHVAKNVNCSVNTLAVLAQDEDPDVRYNVAKHPVANSTVLHQLTGDEYKYIRDAATEAFDKLFDKAI